MELTTSNPAQPHGMTWLRDDRYSWFLAGMMWVLIVLMIVPEGFDYQRLATASAPSSGGPISRMLWLLLLALGIMMVSWRAGLAWLLARVLNPFFLLFVALAIVSVAWSIDPALSIRRLIRLGTIVLACVAFVLMSWHARRYQNVVRPILTIVLLGSIIFGLVFPALAIHQQTTPELIGAWHGLANHKNGLGALACISLIFWFHAWLTREVRFLPALTGGAVAVTCLVLSRSSTSLAATLFVMAVLLVLLRSPQGLRPYMPYLVSMLVALLLIYTLAILNLIPGLGTLMAPVTALTGKDTSLTGRTEIWTILSEHISYRPFLGSGYAAYWTAGPVPGADSYAFVWRMGSFYPGSAHNGYLEIVNDLGWIGLLCLIAYIVVHIRQSLQLLEIDRHQGALFLALFFQQAITNLSETHWFSVQSVDFVIMALATTALARSLLEHRLRLVFGQPQPSTIGTSHGMALPLARESFDRTPDGGA
ncbi:O-antigen ligase [Sulfuricaulis limicola]|uniref:O-antigen ligase n=1 Tax=Sulfuricaulis limicola TaxID=1620215 RepID=A0A1B4XH18_9GAMM|nr:O-antigen ligase family protein [Sulfuricaulis limicola]BAV34112.1 O-antigen ligase [Sulfuricaulis limicola]